MKAKPILFSGSMVRALLAGTKTQTRRIVAGYEIRGPHNPYPTFDWYKNSRWVAAHRGHFTKFTSTNASLLCPYGKPGDYLWVRETWGKVASPPPGRIDRCVRGPDGWGATWRECWQGNPSGYKWRPSIHMPRWASRLTLCIADVRVERLQEISEEDAIAEGIERADDFFGCPCWKCYGADADAVAPDDPIGSYESLWESIHGTNSWQENPWVWVIKFTVIKQNIDEVLREVA